MSVSPLISVITATYRAAPTLPALVRSLEAQRFTDFEWVVQDGGSDDATREIVESSSLPRVAFSSAPDRGIYDAFNRALDAARGEYVLFLGADDRVLDEDTFARASEILRAAPEGLEALLCSVVDDRGVRFVSRLSAGTLVFNTVHHQGVFYRRSLFDRFRYDIGSPVVADYELNLLLRLRRSITSSLDLVVAECASDGVSRTGNEWELYRDLNRLRRKHLPLLPSTGLLTIGLVNVVRRRLLGGRS